MTSIPLTSLYELIILVKPDVSDSAVEEIVNKIGQIIGDHQGKVIRTENWGFRKTAYPIDNNTKMHYRWFGIECNNDCLHELDKRFKLSEQILRHMLIKTKAISQHPSPMVEGVELKEPSIEVEPIKSTVVAASTSTTPMNK